MKTSIWRRLCTWWRRLFSPKEEKSCLIECGQPSLESLAPSTAVLKKAKTFSWWLFKDSREKRNAKKDAICTRLTSKSRINLIDMSPSTLTTDAPAAIPPYLTLPLHHGSLLSVTIIGPTWADSDGPRLEQQLADTLSHGEPSKVFEEATKGACSLPARPHFIATSPLTLTTDPPAAITSYLTLLLPHGNLSRDRIDNTCTADLWSLAGLLQNSILCFSILFIFGLWIYFS